MLVTSPYFCLGAAKVAKLSIFNRSGEYIIIWQLEFNRLLTYCSSLNYYILNLPHQLSTFDYFIDICILFLCIRPSKSCPSKTLRLLILSLTRTHTSSASFVISDPLIMLHLLSVRLQLPPLCLDSVREIYIVELNWGLAQICWCQSSIFRRDISITSVSAKGFCQHASISGFCVKYSEMSHTAARVYTHDHDRNCLSNFLLAEFVHKFDVSNYLTSVSIM